MVSESVDHGACVIIEGSGHDRGDECTERRRKGTWWVEVGGRSSNRKPGGEATWIGFDAMSFGVGSGHGFGSVGGPNTIQVGVVIDQTPWPPGPESTMGQST